MAIQSDFYGTNFGTSFGTSFGASFGKKNWNESTVKMVLLQNCQSNPDFLIQQAQKCPENWNEL